MNGCLSLCVSPITDWQPNYHVPSLSPCGTWRRLQTHCKPWMQMGGWTDGRTDGWTDGWVDEQTDGMKDRWSDGQAGG